MLASCGFPQTCDTYDQKKAAAAGAADSTTKNCALSAKLGDDRYREALGVIVTDVGAPLEEVVVRACPDDATLGGKPSRTVEAYAFGDYCTSDVIAVEVRSGEQLKVFVARDKPTPSLGG
jgi:hypothetical protein